MSEFKHKRKLRNFQHDVTTSSDPAMFSSDDHNPTAEDYAGKRRKEKWHGTWWGEKVGSRAQSNSQGSRRKFTRNFDSGVWMGSEGTDTSFEDEFFGEAEAKISKGSKFTSVLDTEQADRHPAGNISHKAPPAVPPYDAIPCSSQVSNFDNAKIDPLHAAVDQVIDRCLEAGNENVDLSSMSLEEVPNTSLRRLRALTKHSTVQDMPPSQEAYSSIEPALRLYLSTNALRIFPSEIINLTKLRVLSLRHNKLTKIPPGIGRLPNLEQLNIAGNELQNLPFELLGLYETRPSFNMVATPNPFKQFGGEHLIPNNDPITSTSGPSIVARTKARYFYANGSELNTPPSPPLLELALQKCALLPDLTEIQTWCTTGNGPTTLSTPLALAQEAGEYGDNICTVCRRRFVVPRVKWLEWWSLRPCMGLAELNPQLPSWPIFACVLPFLRQGCSWACVEGVETWKREGAEVSPVTMILGPGCTYPPTIERSF
jgi:Leucine Rich repeats (2 copies)